MDYRESHKQRGSSYDKYLADEPFSAYMTEIEHNLLRRIIPSLFSNTLPTYLDFACGTARITSVVSPLTKLSFGVDISESMLEKAKDKCQNTNFIHKDITKDSLDIEQVDLITSFRFFGNAITQFASESHESVGQDAINYTLRQPIGIVGCISPWNLWKKVWCVCLAHCLKRVRL